MFMGAHKLLCLCVCAYVCVHGMSAHASQGIVTHSEEQVGYNEFVAIRIEWKDRD